MKRLIVALTLLLFAMPALADSEAHQGADWVRIFDGPCVSAETLGRIPPEARDKFHKAQGVFQGQKFFGCWRAMDGGVYILWEDGDQGVIPAGELEPVREARSAARHTA